MLLPVFQSTARNFSRSASRSLIACNRIAAVQSAVTFAAARQAQILGVRNISATASALEEYERRRSSERSSRPPRYERREPREPREAPTVPSKALFVGNIPFIAEEDDIRLAFEEFGDIESVRICSFFVDRFGFRLSIAFLFCFNSLGSRWTQQGLRESDLPLARRCDKSGRTRH